MNDVLRIAHLRIAHQGAILRWAILTFTGWNASNERLKQRMKELQKPKSYPVCRRGPLKEKGVKRDNVQLFFVADLQV